MQGETTVGGFEFVGEDDAELAKQEKKKIEYLEQHMDYSTPENILLIYRKAIDQRLFKTPVGFQYLKSMQEYLQECSDIPKEEIPPVKLYVAFDPKLRQKPSPAQQRVVPAKDRKNRRLSPLTLSVMINIILAAAVIAMFSIAISSENANILNYESAIENKYAAWEQQLTERESVVRDKEKELNIDND